MKKDNRKLTVEDVRGMTHAQFSQLHPKVRGRLLKFHNDLDDVFKRLWTILGRANTESISKNNRRVDAAICIAYESLHLAGLLDSKQDE